MQSSLSGATRLWMQLVALQPEVSILEHSCNSASLNYAALDHPPHLLVGGFGFFSSVPCVVVNTAWFIKASKQLGCSRVPQKRGATCTNVFGIFLLMPVGVGFVCMSEVISANRQAAVKSCLASWKSQNLRETHAASSSVPSTSHQLYFFHSLSPTPPTEV